MSALAGKSQHPQVEITVKDKSTGDAEAFQCDLHLLRATMTYFEPLIKKQLQDRQHEHAGKGGQADKTPVCLKVNCDITIFQWLLAWMENTEKPRLTASNAVSVILSSNFLGMAELTDVALHYIKDHLADVLLSGVDMGCVPGDLLGRLCAITTEASMANCLFTLYQKKEERHPNRGFVSALLRHWVADRLMLLSSAVPSSSAQGRASGSGDPFSAVALAPSTRTDASPPSDPAGTSTPATDNGLRWCRVCGILYDERELRRLLAHGGAALSSPLSTKEPLCRGCHGASGRRGGGTHSAARIGSRGEKMTTHAPSRVLPPAAPATLASSARSALEVPPYVGSSGRQDLLVERWAWRLIGVTRFTVCRRCRRLVSLLEVASHACSANQVKAEFVPAERFGSVGSAGSTDMLALIRWYEFAGKESLYAEVGGLKSIFCPAGTVGLMEVETMAPPVCAAAVGASDPSTVNGSGGLTATTTTANGIDGAAAEECHADAADTPTAREPPQKRRGSLSAAEYLAQGGAPRAWAEMPTAVMEVSAIVPAYFRPILSTRQDCPVDVDVENYHERQFFLAMREHLATLMGPTDRQRDAAADACPVLLPFPYTAPPSAPTPPPYTTGTPSPRPMSSGMSSGRRAGGGSLVLGVSISMAKPSRGARRRPTAKSTK